MTSSPDPVSITRLRGAASLRRYCSMLEHFTDVDTLIDAVYRLQA